MKENSIKKFNKLKIKINHFHNSINKNLMYLINKNRNKYQIKNIKIIINLVKKFKKT